MTFTRLIRTLAVCTLIIAGNGCQRSEPLGHQAPTGSSVKITGITPDPSSPLRAGDRIKLRVDIRYTLTADSGTVGLVVQAADNSGIAYNIDALKKGNGKSTLEAEFVVPHTNAVQVFTPLAAQGQTSTSTADIRTYKVISAANAAAAGSPYGLWNFPNNRVYLEIAESGEAFQCRIAPDNSVIRATGKLQGTSAIDWAPVTIVSSAGNPLNSMGVTWGIEQIALKNENLVLIGKYGSFEFVRCCASIPKQCR